MSQTESKYISPFSTRYASAGMQELFSNANKQRWFRKLWVILAKSEKELGLNISDEQITQMEEQTDNIDFSAIAAYEKKLRHDVMASVHAFGDLCPKARPIIHLGATSCYVGDNTDVIIMRDALDMLIARQVSVAKKLVNFAEKYKAMPTLGYTHFQPAQPTTVGKRACLWLQDVLYDLKESKRTRDNLLPLGCKGTTGTQASFLDLFDGDTEKVRKLDDMCAKAMGFERAVPVSGQTYSRKQDSAVLNLLSQIAQTAHKFSNDIRLLQHLKEIEEPFESKQIGSSAMPYKRNPMRSERMAALARFITVNAQNAALTASEQWLERTLDDSANRRIAVAEGFLAADGLLMIFDNIVSGLVVYPAQIKMHLEQELPFMSIENILMEAVKRGGDRQTLHEKLRLHSMAAGKRIKEEGLPNDLLERILSDEDFAFLKENQTELLNPEKYTGCAKEQVDWFIKETVQPILSQFENQKEFSNELWV
ncbi:MAG: adenylosuccinate lyase [Eubacteriales bacterium]|nr:adenylosuccinate lyase [Eubacteriales bacterium]